MLNTRFKSTVAYNDRVEQDAAERAHKRQRA